jgi:hypothetical protein
MNYAPVLGYTFNYTKVAKPIRQPILPKPWSNLELGAIGTGGTLITICQMKHLFQLGLNFAK